MSFVKQRFTIIIQVFGAGAEWQCLNLYELLTINDFNPLPLISYNISLYKTILW